MADKYGITDLKDLAQEKFKSAAAEDWNRTAFVRAAELVFSTTLPSDHGLRNIVVNTIIAHPNLIEDAEIAKLLESGNGIAWKVLQQSWRSSNTKNVRSDMWMFGQQAGLVAHNMKPQQYQQ